jgi:hypothetical protein
MGKLQFNHGEWVVHPFNAWVSPADDIDMPVCALRHPAPDLPEALVRERGNLIAAAPKIYDELAHMTEAYAAHYGEDCPATIRARAALALARGEK